MGITIHYEGRARSEESVSAALAAAREAARASGWPLQEVLEDQGVLERVIDEEEVRYVGPVVGFVLFPHEDAEPLELLFGTDLFTQSYIKTQFAGVATHIQVVAMLRALATHFESFEVIDEGEYWESGDKEQLGALIAGCDEALADLVQASPGARTRVRLENGRIVDALE